MSDGLNNKIRQHTEQFLERVFVSMHQMAAPSQMPLLPPNGKPVSFDIRWGLPQQWAKAVARPPSAPHPVADPLMRAYWLPKGGWISLPIDEPAADFVFTPELNGASIVVDRFDNVTYRVYHVERGNMDSQYTGRPHGQGKVEELGFGDYGVESDTNRSRATGLLHNSLRRGWQIYGQAVEGPPQFLMNGQIVNHGMQRVRKLIRKNLVDQGAESVLD